MSFTRRYFKRGSTIIVGLCIINWIRLYVAITVVYMPRFPDSATNGFSANALQLLCVLNNTVGLTGSFYAM